MSPSTAAITNNAIKIPRQFLSPGDAATISWIRRHMKESKTKEYELVTHEYAIISFVQFPFAPHFDEGNRNLRSADHTLFFHSKGNWETNRCNLNFKVRWDYRLQMRIHLIVGNQRDFLRRSRNDGRFLNIRLHNNLFYCFVFVLEIDICRDLRSHTHAQPMARTKKTPPTINSVTVFVYVNMWMRASLSSLVEESNFGGLLFCTCFFFPFLFFWICMSDNMWLWMCQCVRTKDKLLLVFVFLFFFRIVARILLSHLINDRGEKHVNYHRNHKTNCHISHIRRWETKLIKSNERNVAYAEQKKKMHEILKNHAQRSETLDVVSLPKIFVSNLGELKNIYRINPF